MRTHFTHRANAFWSLCERVSHADQPRFTWYRLHVKCVIPLLYLTGTVFSCLIFQHSHTTNIQYRSLKSSRSVFIKKRNPFRVSQRKRYANAHVACNGSFPRCVLRCVYLCARNFFPLHVRINGIFILAPFQRYGVSIDLLFLVGFGAVSCEEI